MSSPVPEAPDPRLTAEPPLRQFTEEARRPKGIEWYRSPLPPGAMKSLHVRSNLRGAAQTLGYLAILAAPAGLAIRAGLAHAWGWAALGVFLYGVIAAFLINGVHELGHNTVFRSAWLNRWFCRLLAFLGWINHEVFETSHVRHHRYTLHPPDDDENPLPIRFTARDFFKGCVFHYGFFVYAIRKMVRLARGRFEGTWEQTLFPADQPAIARPAVLWARVVLAGHLVHVAQVVALAERRCNVERLVHSNGCRNRLFDQHVQRGDVQSVQHLLGFFGTWTDVATRKVWGCHGDKGF